MPAIERLRLDHAVALLAFERENRAYFAASVSDRGDDYFTHFDERHRPGERDQWRPTRPVRAAAGRRRTGT